jgi:hypothetical protein
MRSSLEHSWGRRTDVGASEKESDGRWVVSEDEENIFWASSVFLGLKPLRPAHLFEQARSARATIGHGASPVQRTI